MSSSAILVNGSELGNENQLTTDHYRQINLHKNSLLLKDQYSTFSGGGSDPVSSSAILVNGSELWNKNQLTTDHYRQS